jgi:hypothetical protein
MFLFFVFLALIVTPVASMVDQVFQDVQSKRKGRQ